MLEILLESDGSPRKFNPDKQQTDPNPIRIDEEEEVEDWSEIAAEQMIEEEEEEEDWSNDSATTSIANKLYCGETRGKSSMMAIFISLEDGLTCGPFSCR